MSSVSQAVRSCRSYTSSDRAVRTARACASWCCLWERARVAVTNSDVTPDRISSPQFGEQILSWRSSKSDDKVRGRTLRVERRHLVPVLDPCGLDSRLSNTMSSTFSHTFHSSIYACNLLPPFLPRPFFDPHRWIANPRMHWFGESPHNDSSGVCLLSSETPLK